MEFDVSKAIFVTNPTDEFKRWAKDELTLPNPDYYKKVQMGKWTGNTPESFKLYEMKPNEMIIPFGMLNTLYQKYGRRCTFRRCFCNLRRVNYESHIELYPYQEKAVYEALRQRNGIIVMPCGAGKTQTALEIIAQIGGRALWLTHTQDLLNQSMSRAKSVFGIDDKSYGIITGGKVKIGSGITFATVQTMVKLDLDKYSNDFDIVVVDECHKAVGSPTKCMQFYKVISSLNCRYKFGVTATPKRSDGMIKSMFSLIGDKIYEVDKSEVKNTTCPVIVETTITNYTPNLDIVLAGDGTLNYSALIDDMTHDDDRFNLVLDVIMACDDSCLVLANRVDYLKRLSDEYNKRHGGFEPSICLSGMGTSQNAKRLRRNALKALNDGEIDCLFATYQLAKEGLDVPNLKYVVLATPEKDETTVTQATGRVGRKADGKDKGTVIDFVDDFAMLNGWYKKRKNYYKKLDYKIWEAF